MKIIVLDVLFWKQKEVSSFINYFEMHMYTRQTLCVSNLSC